MILAGALLALQSGVGGGWRGVRAADGELAASALARARLAAAGIETPLAAGAQSGRTADGLAWTLTMSAYGPPEAEVPAGRLVAYWVAAEVRWRDNPFRPDRAVTLTTLKMRMKP